MAIVTPEEFYANFTSDVQSIFCYKAVQTTSPGIWLANNPLMFPFPLLLFQLTLIFIFTRITQSILSHLSIPIHISQIIGGIILGPSCIGRYEPFEKIMYSAHGWEQLNLISSYAIFFFFFIIGLKTDLSMISKTGKKAIAIAISSAIIPFTAIILTIHFSNNRLPPRFKERFVILNALIPWTTTSCIVISSTLADLNLLTSKLGRLAMSASLITEFANLFIRAALDSYLLMKKHHSVTIGVTSMSANLGFMVFLVFIARPVTIRAIRRTPEGSMLDEKSFIGVLGLAMVCGLITDVIGARPFVGPFFLGLVLPGGAPLGVTMVEKLGRLVEGVLCPVFLALAGIRMDVGSLKMGNVEWKVLLLFLIIVVLGEFLGAMMPCFYCQMPVRDCVAVGLMVISKGILEAATACRLQDQKVFLIILPFHKQLDIDGSITTPIPAIQAVNSSVLRFAPCSVAVHVNHNPVEESIAFGSVTLPSPAVYFFGGPDDREALACGIRMAEDPSVGLTVVRFRHPEALLDGTEERLDEKMLEEVRMMRDGGSGVVYMEEMVRDSEEIVGVIKEVSGRFSLLLVGRGDGKEMTLMSGLSAWSEYPELGIIGDLLASTDFGSRVSTLVVQQQRRVVGKGLLKNTSISKHVNLHEEDEDEDD